MNEELKQYFRPEFLNRLVRPAPSWKFQNRFCPSFPEWFLGQIHLNSGVHGQREFYAVIQDEIIVFRQLTKPEVKEIADIMLRVRFHLHPLCFFSCPVIRCMTSAE